jgi:hypothetical protein
MTDVASGLVYSSQAVGRLLGVKTPKVEPTPTHFCGLNRYLVFVPKKVARDFAYLRSTSAAHLISGDDWYDGCYSCPSGYWEVDVPLRGSEERTHAGQRHFLRRHCPEFQHAPLAVLATLWSAHKLTTGQGLFPQGQLYIRCAEQSHHDQCVALGERDGKLTPFSCWYPDDDRDNTYFAAAARRISSSNLVSRMFSFLWS